MVPAFVESMAHIRADASRAFPNGCTVRILDRTLTGAADWPRLFSPTTVATDAVEYAFEGFCMRVTDSAITRVYDEMIDEEGEDSDLDYESNEENESSESDSNSNSEYDSEGL